MQNESPNHLKRRGFRPTDFGQRALENENRRLIAFALH
jgi:hypothetical protein